MVQHVKLARDRRKRKSRIKAAIFFVSILLIASGALLSLKESTNEEPYVQAQVQPEVVDNVQYQSLTPAQTNADKPTSTAENDVDGVKEGDEQ